MLEARSPVELVSCTTRLPPEVFQQKPPMRLASAMRRRVGTARPGRYQAYKFNVTKAFTFSADHLRINCWRAPQGR